MYQHIVATLSLIIAAASLAFTVYTTELPPSVPLPPPVVLRVA